MRRTIALACAALAVLVATAACSVKDGSTGGNAKGKKQITFLVFETPNMTSQVWDAAIKRVTDRYPDIAVKKLVSPTQDRTAYAKQLLTSGQFPDVMIAVSPAGFAESGNLYAWRPSELKAFEFPGNGAILSWQMLGFCAVVYLAGLQGIPQELYEAAAIDGAGPVQRFRKITWPLLAPALTINTIVMLITGFKAFDHIQVITNGGPGTGTTATIAFNVLQTGFDANRQGYASAMAIVMLLIVAVVSAVALRILQRREVSL